MSISLIDGHIDPDTNRMTDNDIIKALECCNKSDNGKGCFECPYRQYCPDCLRRRNEDTIDLINRQKEEIEALVAGQETLQKNLAKAIKAEAVKEFAEELIYKIVNTPTKFESTYYMYREGIAFRQNEIIDIIKEMAGENND